MERTLLRSLPDEPSTKHRFLSRTSSTDDRLLDEALFLASDLHQGLGRVLAYISMVLPDMDGRTGSRWTICSHDWHMAWMRDVLPMPTVLVSMLWYSRIPTYNFKTYQEDRQLGA